MTTKGIIVRRDWQREESAFMWRSLRSPKAWFVLVSELFKKLTLQISLLI
jgi:hypothetical protein